MGTRITAFALDRVGFSAWLDRPVADVLFYVARHAQGEPPFFHVFEPESRQRYLISMKREVLRVGVGAVGAAVPVTPESAAGIPILRKPLADHIREEDGLPFKFLLSSLAACPQEKWLRVLTEGHRPWWLFSVLRGAREAFLAPPDLRDLEELCARILRGHHFSESPCNR